MVLFGPYNHFLIAVAQMHFVDCISRCKLNPDFSFLKKGCFIAFLDIHIYGLILGQNKEGTRYLQDGMNPLSLGYLKCLQQIIILKEVNSNPCGYEDTISKKKLVVKGSTMALIYFLIGKFFNLPLAQSISQIFQVVEAATLSAKRKRHIFTWINFYIFEVRHIALSH